MSEASSRSILLIDAYSLFIRHYQANPTLSQLGHHMGGTVGFLKTIKYVVDQFLPEKVFVVWEGGGSPRRRKLYPDYKIGRRPLHMNKFFDEDIPDTYENRNRQIRSLVSFMTDLPICQIYVPDCEADDVIGYVCKRVFPDRQKIILSSDHDMYQLIDENTKVCTSTRKKVIDIDEVKKEYGVYPRNFCQVRALCGDTSDNIPGIRGAGFKSVVKRFPMVAEDRDVLLQEIIDHGRDMNGTSKIKLYERLRDSEKDVLRNWKLMYLDTNNLTPNQIERISKTIDTFKPSLNKIGFTRQLISEGLSSFDVDWFFYTISILR